MSAESPARARHASSGDDKCHGARDFFRTAKQHEQERASLPRSQRLHSISSAVMGVMACARLIWSAEHSLRPTYLTFPSSTSSCKHGNFSNSYLTQTSRRLWQRIRHAHDRPLTTVHTLLSRWLLSP